MKKRMEALMVVLFLLICLLVANESYWVQGAIVGKDTDAEKVPELNTVEIMAPIEEAIRREQLVDDVELLKKQVTDQEEKLKNCEEQLAIQQQELERLEEQFVKQQKKLEKQKEENRKDKEKIKKLKKKLVEVSKPGYPYELTDEEFEVVCKLVYAESFNQGILGMVYHANAIFNHALANNKSILKEIYSGRYTTVKNGAVGNMRKNGKFDVVSDSKITDEVRDAVKIAQKHDYTVEVLKQEAKKLGLDEKYYETGAQYFYAPKAVTDPRQLRMRDNIKVKFRYKDVIFYAYWNH